MKLKSLGWKKGYRDEDTGAWYSDKPFSPKKAALIIAVCSLASTVSALVAIILIAWRG